MTNKYSFRNNILNFRSYSKTKKKSKILPKHQSWDHEIFLIEDKQPNAQLIYSLSQKKLSALKKYIEKNLKKSYIRPSKSPARYSIFFILKRNEKLRLCVNYKRFNEITVKNRYTLSLINEMQNRIHGAKIFIKLDLREAYYKIRMKKDEEWKIA